MANEFINHNADEHFKKSTTTTDATPATLNTLTISANEVGFIMIKAIGVNPANGDAITGIRSYRYKKIAGTLTLGSAVAILPVVADGSVSTATFAAAAASNNIAVNATGVAATTIIWNVVIERTALTNYAVA